MSSPKSLRVAPFAFCLLFAPHASAAPATFQVVADNGFYGANATAVSSDGSAVLTVKGFGSGGAGLYRWRAGVSTPLTSGLYVNWGGLSADGSIAVGGRSTPTEPLQAFRWQNGTLTYLGSGTTTGRDVSADGSTIVGMGASEAYRYEAGVVTYLGDLSGGADSSEAWAVDGNGTVVVGQGTSATGTEAFRWQGGQMVGLGDLAGGAFASEAHDISLDGSVVVGWGTGASGTEAFRWENGVMTGLGLLDGTYPTRARGVSGDGSLIVGEAIIGSREEANVAVFWDATGVHVLQDWLLQQFGLDLSGYELRSAFGVSSDGRTIVGEGWYSPVGSGPYRIGWMVTVPEPGTASLSMFGVLGLAALHRRPH